MGETKHYITKYGEEVECLLCRKTIIKQAYSLGVETPVGEHVRICIHCAIDVGELGKEARRVENDD